MTKSKSDDLGSSEVQEKVDEETEKGYRGTKVDPLPNSAYSLASGPDSPNLPDDRTRVDQAHVSTEG